MKLSFLIRCCLILFAVLGLRLAQAADPEPLPPQEAFQLATPHYDGKAIILDYTIAPGYYMYRTRFDFRLEPATSLGAAEFPPGQIKDDKNMGRVETYHNSLRIRIPVTGTLDLEKTTLVARSQGCADFGLCYVPYTHRIKLSTAAAGSVTTPGSGLLDEVTGKKKSPDFSLSNKSSDDSALGRLLAGRQWWLIALTFVALGLGLSLTACLYPLIPIISGIIITGGTGRGRAFSLSLAYSQGVAVTYALAGIAAGLTGTVLAQTLQTPWVLGTFALLFVLLALAMFGLFQLQLPSALQSALADSANRLPRGRLVTVFVMGMLSAVIIGPCMAPPLAAALLYIGQTGDALTGGIALYALGVGLGLPLIAVGVFGASLLPHAGPWMNTVRRAYGVVLLALALWIAQPVLSTAVLMLAWSALLVGCGVFMHALEPLPVNADPFRRLTKAGGVLLLSAGIALLLGCLAGNRDPLQPLRGVLGSAQATTRPVPVFTPVLSSAALDNALNSARGRPVLVDVYADWCIACHELERETFPAPAVADLLSGFATVKFDVTANSAEQRAWLQQHSLFGPPALLLYDRDGTLRRTLVGFQTPVQLLAALKEVQ